MYYDYLYKYEMFQHQDVLNTPPVKQFDRRVVQQELQLKKYSGVITNITAHMIT